MCTNPEAIPQAVMKMSRRLHFSLAVLTLTFALPGHAQIAPSELVTPKLEISGSDINFTVQPSASGRNYQLQCSDTMENGTWTDVGVVRSGNDGNLVISTPYESAVHRRFYRVALVEAPAAPNGFSLISAGSFSMGNALSTSEDLLSNELPQHSVYVTAFYMAKYEVTKALWDEARTWGTSHGYTDLRAGEGKVDTHPVQMITWYDMVKWCNARSQRDGLTPCYYTDAAQTVVFKTGTNIIDNTMVRWNANGYRLPTEAEWEKAARGGLIGKRFPWGDAIMHSQANYFVYSANGTTNYFSYDVSPTRGFHPTYLTGPQPYTAPVGSFAPNGYGLYDMAGNVNELCWDSYAIYTADSQTDPHGTAADSRRVFRGGVWQDSAGACRVSYRYFYHSVSYDNDIGFRLARSSVP